MKTEKTVAAIFLVGIIFKLLHWPGGGPLVVVSLLVIAMLYFPFGFYFFCDKKIKQQNLPLSIISGAALAVIPIGVMYKIQSWPGAQVDLVLGLFSAPIILAGVYYLRKKAIPDLVIYYKNMLQRTILLLTVTVIMYLIPTATIIKHQYWNDPELAKLTIQYFSDPNNPDYVRQYNACRMNRDSVFYKMNASD
jgi:hypothetical protein